MSIIRGLFVFAVMAWLTMVSFLEPSSAAGSAHSFVIRNVRVYDGEKVIPKTDVAVAICQWKLSGTASNRPCR